MTALDEPMRSFEGIRFRAQKSNPLALYDALLGTEKRDELFLQAATVLVQAMSDEDLDNAWQGASTHQRLADPAAVNECKTRHPRIHTRCH